jgi:SAM-dependent methyltransferase
MPEVDHYDAQYGNFQDTVLAEVRQDAFGEDIGQTGWLTSDEQDLFIRWLSLSSKSHLLDIACGSGRPTLRIAKATGCSISGMDLHDDAVKTARRYASETGLHDRAQFLPGDASCDLPFPDEHFDAVTCIDAINHLPDRLHVFREWYRVLQPGGIALFTDPIVVTGPLTNEEIAIRASIGFFVFTPVGSTESLLSEAKFQNIEAVDRTANMARNARGWLNARAAREAELRKIEGGESYEGQQQFFSTAAQLAEERRLSRIAYLARKSG